MNITRPKNTKESGVVEFLVYKEDSTFIGVCFTFDLIQEGNDPEKLMEDLHELAKRHLETVRELRWPDELLNRYAPEEYWKKYFEAIKSAEKPIPSPYLIRHEL